MISLYLGITIILFTTTVGIKQGLPLSLWLSLFFLNYIFNILIQFISRVFRRGTFTLRNVKNVRRIHVWIDVFWVLYLIHGNKTDSGQ